MKKEEAVRIVIDVLKSVQEISGRKDSEIVGSTCPIGDLTEFDSLSGVEASAMLSDRVGFELPGVNAFVNEQGTKSLSVNQIAEAICKFSAEVRS
ncbi:acyl carrier protein [uncultured Rubinisphaera sp.]|uniref:acyl carrier protein n=1 Tax=uncultured Rubinisphaera sp. TaxID=1678686 RepID=UPI0030D86E44|tara:strand:- start:24 stop:308 length:285 start_codon:yes stop_codon:yes gene_type:complete